MLRVLLCLMAMCAHAFAAEYFVEQKIALSGAATAITVQQPATGAKTLRGKHAYIACDATSPCYVTLERDGTAATTTLVTPSKVLSTANPSKSTGYIASNVGAGAIAITYMVSAGGSTSINLRDLAQFNNGTAYNISLRSATMTATFLTLRINYEEY